MNRKLDELGRIVIPIEIRKELDLKPDDKMEIVQDGEKIIITKYKDTYCPECLTRCNHTDNFCRNCGLNFWKNSLNGANK